MVKSQLTVFATNQSNLFKCHSVSMTFLGWTELEGYMTLRRLTFEFFYNSSFLSNPGRKWRIRKTRLCDVFAVISYIFVSAAIFYILFDGWRILVTGTTNTLNIPEPTLCRQQIIFYFSLFIAGVAIDDLKH